MLCIILYLAKNRMIVLIYHYNPNKTKNESIRVGFGVGFGVGLGVGLAIANVKDE